MAQDGIVESSPATVLKRTPVDFEIEVPIVGTETGDELGTTVSRVSGVHRSKYVTHDGDVIKEYDDELDYQELTPLKGSATETVLKAKKDEGQHSLLLKIVDTLSQKANDLWGMVAKAEERDARREYDQSVEALVDSMAQDIVSKSAEYGAGPELSLAQAKADVWLHHPELVKRYEDERMQKQDVTAYVQKLEKQMPLETDNRNLGDANIVDNLNDPKEILEELTQRIQDTAADGGEKITYEVAYSRAVQTPAGKAALARLNANRVQ